MRLSIDTNAYRAFVDCDPVFVSAVEEARVLAFSVVVLGELRAGFLNGTRQSHNEQILRQVLATKRVEIHELTDATSSAYASVWSELRRKGLPIPTNDVWIAAQCIERDFTLVTRDAHFSTVSELQVYSQNQR